MNETPQIAPTETALQELDALYQRYRQLEHVATWGGSYEREHGARTELKPIVNKNVRYVAGVA